MSRRSSSRTSCPSRAPRCTLRLRARATSISWSIAAARIILPPDIHLQAPPNLSDDFGVLLDAGIDDWGGVSPVTADHVNPERPWPALDRLRDVDRGAGLRPRAPPHDLPRVRARARRAGSTRRCASRCMDRSDAEGLGRDDPGAVFPERVESCVDPTRAPTSSIVGDRSTAWYSGAECIPRRWCRRQPRADGAVRRGARRRAGRPGARHRRARHPVRRAGPRGRRGRRGGRRASASDGRRRRHLRAQPQHQLHQRVHLQVPVLRVLQGSAVAEPAGHAVPAHARGHRSSASSRLPSWGPPRSACRAASTRTSTATTTSTCAAP